MTQAIMDNPLRSRMRTVAVVVAAAAALLATLALQPPDAEATAVGCTGAGPIQEVDTVCLGIYGDGADVDSFRVTYNNHLPGGGVPQEACNYEASVTIDPPGDFNAYRFWSGRHEGCSYTGVYYFDFPGQKGLPDGTRICGRFYVDNGSQVGGAPCNEIEA